MTAKTASADASGGEPTAATSGSTGANGPGRSPEQIQAEIDAAQKRLADQVDVLSERLAPQALAEEAIDGVKKVFIDPDGSPKRKPIAIAVGTVASLLLLRKIFHR
jgi:hypothetical protein